MISCTLKSGNTEWKMQKVHLYEKFFCIKRLNLDMFHCIIATDWR